MVHIRRTLGWWSCTKVLRTIPNTLPLRGSSREYSGQGPLNPIIKGLFLAGNSTPTIPHMFSNLTASARMQASPLAAPTRTRLLWTDDGAAMSTKLARGCGSLGAASPAWGAFPSSRLQRGRVLLRAMRGTSVQPSQNGIASRLSLI